MLNEEVERSLRSAYSRTFSLYLALLLSFHMYELQGLYMVIQKYHLVW